MTLSLQALAKDVLKLTSAIMGKLINPAGLTVSLLFLAVFYLIPNNQIIGADKDLVFSYAVMFVLMLLWAVYRKVPLERLDWTARDLINKKFQKKPLQAHWGFLIAFIAFIGTVAFALFRYQTEKADLGSQLAMDMMWQQLLIITLAETVIFQGLFPLIVEWELETSKEAKGISYLAILITVILISQGLFGASHYWAYGGEWMVILWAMIPGTLWYLASRYFGLQVAWLSHFGWNCVALGLIGIAVIGG